jgi:hypothetical protein
MPQTGSIFIVEAGEFTSGVGARTMLQHVKVYRFKAVMRMK